MNTVAAIVPMKGESLRLPKKNLKNFNGKPLFYWIIQSLFLSKRVSSVYVDTDCLEIINLVRTYFPKVIIIKRLSSLVGNSISMNQILAHDLKLIDSDHILQTHATNPLLKAETIEKAIERYFWALKNSYDSLFSVTVWHKRLYDSSGKPLNHDPKKLVNTQDLDPIYEENSNLYIFSKNSFKANCENRLGLKPYLFPISLLESIDIDYNEEFLLAEACAHILGKLS